MTKFFQQKLTREITAHYLIPNSCAPNGAQVLRGA